MLTQFIARIRAAHGLAFAISSGTKPNTTDLRTMGLRRWIRDPRRNGIDG